MHEIQRQQAEIVFQEKGVEAALFASLFSVTWLTGYAPSVHLGPEPTAGGPALLWFSGGAWTLIVTDREEGQARQSGCQVAVYPGMTLTEPLNGPAHLADRLRETVESSQIKGNVGVEEQSLPVFQSSALRDALPRGTQVLPIDGWFNAVRAVKTSEEIEKIRASLRLSRVGHAAARGLQLAGQREIDVWTAVQSAVEREAGEQLALGNNCFVGRRAEGGGGFPSTEKIRPDDTLILDLSARRAGYWGASTVTYPAGRSSAEQSRMFQVVKNGLDLAISLAKPGAIPREIDRSVRETITQAGYPDYPHHTGHGVGASGHEEPRITPYNQAPLQPGMIVALEPAVYLPGQAGVRLEHVVLITNQGNEILFEA
ncbi:MAG TPA: Xaa-Pro peptidase family protein [Anaerolineaceae bacterium]|nr:Xaa-Pro peptidase family protein [Anaerolineaceae bacterium]